MRYEYLVRIICISYGIYDEIFYVEVMNYLDAQYECNYNLATSIIHMKCTEYVTSHREDYYCNNYGSALYKNN